MIVTNPIWFFALMLIISCQSTPDKDSAGVGDAAPKIEEVQHKPIAQGEWKKFFNAEPQNDQRVVLEAKLKSWQDDSPDGLLEKAKKQEALGNYAEAEKTLRQAIRLKNDPQIKLELAAVYLKTRESAKAWGYLNEIQQHESQARGLDTAFDFRFRYVLALFYFRAGEPAKGKQLLSDLLIEDKTFIPAYTAMASYYLNQDKIETAEFILQRAMDRVTVDENLANAMGAVYLRANQPTQAKHWLGKALEISPSFGPALVNRATLYLKEGNQELAGQDLAKVESKGPKPPSYYVVLGIMLRQNAKYEQSERAFLSALDQDPEDCFAKYNLAGLYQSHLGQASRARQLFAEVVQIVGKKSSLGELAQLNVESMSR